MTRADGLEPADAICFLNHDLADLKDCLDFWFGADQ